MSEQRTREPRSGKPRARTAPPPDRAAGEEQATGPAAVEEDRTAEAESTAASSSQSPSPPPPPHPPRSPRRSSSRPKARPPAHAPTTPIDPASSDASSPADRALLYDAITTLEEVLRGVSELMALVGAAGHLATGAARPDSAEGRRTSRRLGFLLLAAARRGEALEAESDAKVRSLLARWDARRDAE